MLSLQPHLLCPACQKDRDPLAGSRRCWHGAAERREVQRQCCWMQRWSTQTGSWARSLHHQPLSPSHASMFIFDILFIDPWTSCQYECTLRSSICIASCIMNKVVWIWGIDEVQSMLTASFSDLLNRQTAVCKRNLLMLFRWSSTVIKGLQDDWRQRYRSEFIQSRYCKILESGIMV